MITLKLLNRLEISVLDKSLISFKLDTGNLPFSIDAKIIPFYRYSFWINKHKETYSNGSVGQVTDILIPVILDLRICKDLK